MNFVWLTDNYRVNIESIFSLEHQYIKNPKYNEWKLKYENLLNSYKSQLIPLKKDDGEFLKLTSNSTKEDIELYAQLIADEIYDKIGETPDEYNDYYQIILSTGLKIGITKDKFDIINKIIDKIEKRED